MNEQLIPVSGNQKIAFQCQRCGACCRHVENKIMLEPYDVYQLALHFQSKGQTIRPEDICAQYAHPMPLEPYFPIFLLNTAGEDQHCIFLNGKRPLRKAAPARWQNSLPGSVFQPSAVMLVGRLSAASPVHGRRLKPPFKRALISRSCPISAL